MLKTNPELSVHKKNYASPQVKEIKINLSRQILESSPTPGYNSGESTIVDPSGAWD